ncbi:MAG: fimbrillin family protein [Proteiniphilum sp.]
MEAKELFTKVSRFLAMTNPKQAWLCSFGLTKTLFFSLLCLIFSSCEGDTPTPPGALGEEVRLSATIEGLKTRASGSTWDKGDAIGVYMKKSGEALSSSAIAMNINYQTTGTSAFLPAKGATTITFPLDGSNVDFIGYYPYKEDISNFIYPIDLSDQSVQANIDLLYSDNAKTFNADNPDINMSFSHQLSKIALQIEHEFRPTLSDIEIIITNVATKANFDLKDGTLSAPSATEDIACMVAANGLTAEAILLPTSDLSGIEFWFLLDEETFKYPLSSVPEIQSFEKSTRYTYNIYLNSDLIPVVTVGEISDWTEGPSVNATLPTTNDPPPSIPGSKRSPYTVSEAQEHQGKASVWVEGYIVGSFDGSINKFIPGTTGAKNTNLALADNQDETDTDKMIPVELPSSGTIREALNLVSKPENFNKKVKIKGNLIEYYGAPGLKSPKEYVWIESVP